MIVGIDLGTTNSLIGIFRDGETELIPNVFGELMTPSIVGLSDDDAILIGAAAADRLTTHPDRTVATFKRQMGTERVFRLGRKKMRAEELSALIIRSLVRDAEEYLGEAVTEAVISVPAYFNDTQRNATKTAAEIAGLRVERLINEPTAAALAYGLHEERDENTFLVFDVGGGTFDVSVLEQFDGVMEVHASAGDNFLGGEDFVDALVSMWRDKTGIQNLRPEEEAQLRRLTELAKRELNSEATVTLKVVVEGNPVECEISATDYEKRVTPLLMRLRQPVEQALRDARIRVDALDEVVLVGGSTKKRLIQRLVAQIFGKLPLRHINPDEVVARGAAVQAGLKMRDAALDDVVLTDVCPYTLGIETTRENQPNEFLEGVMSAIIERNTLIPASRVDTYYPIHDDQKVIAIKIYQGESRQVANNIKLGEFEVKLPRKSKGGETAVDVRFTYDENGLLEVIATVRATGREERMVISQNSGRMSKREIEKALKSLDKLKIHPRDQDENIALLNRANRVYAQYLGADREYIGRLIDEFQLVLERQEPREIRAFRAEFTEWLDRIESL